MCVLFVSTRPFERSENIRTVFNAYDGEKQFAQKFPNKPLKDLGRFRLMVTDELLNESPGKYIFIGHGAGAGKTYGLDQPHPYFHRPDLITYAIASSEMMVPVVAKQLGLSKTQVIPLGFPRMDIYSKPTKTQNFWLFAPTFRPWEVQIDWNIIHRHMPNDMRFIVKPHMVQPDVLPCSYWQGIETASPNEPSADYLMQMSALVTDYSSIMFDAMVMRKPYVLFAKDRDRYLDTRGMYYLYPIDYGPYYCDNEADLIPMLKAAEWNTSCEDFRNFYVGACDGHSTERLIDLIRSIL